MRSTSWLFLYAVATVHAFSWTATPFNPPSIPLAVRSPYLSAWLPQGQGAALNDGWPQFWAGQTLGWAGFVKVDGVSYSFLGVPSVPDTSFNKAAQKSFSFTATKSIFVLSAGPVDITITFLSPVEPTDLVKHSIPFSYMAVTAASTDGAAHSVQVYSDISAEWTSGSDSWDVTWSTTTGSVITHQVQVSSPAPYEEVNDQTQYGSMYYTTLNDRRVTYQTGIDWQVREQFLNHSVLANTKDTNFRSVSSSWPVFALSHDLGQVTSPNNSTTAVIAIGHVRDPAVKYIVAGNKLQERSLYFWSRYPSVSSVINFFLHDYANALATSNKFDAKLQSDSQKISDDYAGITALSIRQAFAAGELTISKTTSGSWNTSDVLYFMKEISSDGNTNTVDVIFPAMPLYVYTAPALLNYLLEPLFRYGVSGLYPNPWSVHDMGAHYPKAIGHNFGEDEAMPVEESGNMLIMSLLYAKKTGDLSQIRRYTKILDQWTQFLITDSLIPAHQLSTDDFAGQLANQTNLAIKGIVGIRAMADIARLLGDKAKSDNYTAIAQDYVTKWQGYATASTGDHLTLAYNQDDTWGLAYNLLGDKLLGFNLFPQSVYEMQTKWYQKVTQSYGVPLDTRHTYTKTDWQVWTSGIVTDTSTRDFFLSSLKKYLVSGKNNVPFSDWYETTTGQSVGFRARPVVGGHLALLIL